MNTRHLQRLLGSIDDTGEVVVSGARGHRDLLHSVWRSAQDEANDAFAIWCERGGCEPWVVYLAATDRADAAFDAFAGRRDVV
jgi:hypothetical protein